VVRWDLLGEPKGQI